MILTAPSCLAMVIACASGWRQPPSMCPVESGSPHRGQLRLFAMPYLKASLLFEVSPRGFEGEGLERLRGLVVFPEVEAAG